MYKKKSKLDAGNYRPVSVLTSISKVLEKPYTRLRGIVMLTTSFSQCNLDLEGILNRQMFGILT